MMTRPLLLSAIVLLTMPATADTTSERVAAVTKTGAHVAPIEKQDGLSLKANVFATCLTPKKTTTSKT